MDVLIVISLLLCALFYLDVRRMVRYESRYRSDARSALLMLLGVPQRGRDVSQDWTRKTTRHSYVIGGGGGGGSNGRCGGAGGAGVVVYYSGYGGGGGGSWK